MMRIPVLTQEPLEVYQSNLKRTVETFRTIRIDINRFYKPDGGLLWIIYGGFINHTTGTQTQIRVNDPEQNLASVILAYVDKDVETGDCPVIFIKEVSAGVYVSASSPLPFPLGESNNISLDGAAGTFAHLYIKEVKNL